MKEIRLIAGRWEQGCYGVVVKDTGSGRAIKLFFRGEDEAHSRKVYQSEVEAYEIVQLHPRLVELTADFFGRCSVAKVFDEHGADISDRFLLDCGLELELLSGPFPKIGSCFGSTNRNEVERAFNDAGIRHTSDAGVMLDDQRQIIKIIDFATVEYERFHK